jgi:insulysin
MALKIAEMTERAFTESAGTKPLLPAQLAHYREVDLPDRSFYVFQEHNDVHPSSSIEIYYQADLQSTCSNMLLELFSYIVKEQCFNVLRTQEQLGYLIHLGLRRAHGSQGLQVLVQSEHNPLYIESRIEAFIKSTERCLKTMSEEEFHKHMQALAVKRLDKPKRLVDECNKHWKEIVSHQYNFDRGMHEQICSETVHLKL